MLSLRSRWFVTLALALLVACSPPKFSNVDITGADYARDFSLLDHSGARRTLADYRGKLVLVFFGYTQCPDVCPTTLTDAAEVRKRLGASGDQVQVLFVTLDPERDSPGVLAQYVPGFDASFRGLYGSAEETTKVAREFKVFFQKVDGKTPTSYTLDHTAGTYVFDKEGRIRLFVRHAAPVDQVVADLKQLL